MLARVSCPNRFDPGGAEQSTVFFRKEVECEGLAEKYGAILEELKVRNSTTCATHKRSLPFRLNVEENKRFKNCLPTRKRRI